MSTEYVYSSANSNPEAGLVITISYAARDKATGVSGHAGTGWDGETWEFEMMRVLAVLAGTVTNIQLNIRLIFGGVPGWVDDVFYLEVWNGVAWVTVETWNAGNPPPLVYTVHNEDLSAILTTFALINGGKVRIRGVAANGEDTIEIYVDYVEFVITYTADSEENNYFATTAGCELYDWDEEVSGNYTLKTPNERSVTPIGIIAAGSPVSAAEKAKTDDDDFEQHTNWVGDAPALYTKRCAIMAKIVITETEGDVTRLDVLMRGAHYYIFKSAYMYWWNHNTSLWEQITNTWGTTFESGQNERPHTLKKDEQVNMANYIDTNTIYVMNWDFSGQYSTGCLKEGTLLKTPDGRKKIEDIRLGEFVIGEFRGYRVKTQVIGRSEHDGKWLLYDVEGIETTEDHEFIKKGKKVRADKLSNRFSMFKGKVYDLRTETENYIGYAKGKEALIHNRIMKA